MNIINSRFSINVRDTLFKSFKQFKQDPNQCIAIEQNACDALSSEFGHDESDPKTPYFDPTNPTKMIQFLEYIILNEPDKADESIYNSLLDCYLIDCKKASEPVERDRLRDEIMSYLQDNRGKYSTEQAMISCRMNHFMDGLLFLYQQVQLYDLILDHYVEVGDVDKILETCDKFSEEDERLWVRAFWYFAKTPDVEISHLNRVLEEVDKRNLIPPISIIDILSENSPTATLGAIKNYLSQWLTKHSESVTKNYNSIHRYQDSTEKMRDEIQSIRTQPKIFQSSRCSFCKVHLELPSIHFLCGHSYHQGCLESPSDKGCPLCLPEQIKLSSMIESRKNQDFDLLLNNQ